MTVQHAEALVTAAHQVHDEVWFRYWREGMTELRPSQVIDAVRKVRVRARVDESELPAGLRELLEASRASLDERSQVPLAELITQLKLIFMAPRLKV